MSSFFSWFFMVFFLLAYISSVGWCRYGQDKSLFIGEDFDPSLKMVLLVGPWYILREFFANIIEFIKVGFMMLISAQYRDVVLGEELSEYTFKEDEE